MTIDRPKYTDHAQAPGAAGIKETDMMKVQIVEMINGAAVKFPITGKAELLAIFPKSTPVGCSYKGETQTMYQLIQHLDGSDFPIKNAGELATILTTRCFL
jgi:hypothetical protein